MCDDNELNPLDTRIERIRIEGLRSIANADVPLHAMNVLLGENGAGKSSFLTAFRLLRSIGAHAFDGFVVQAGGASAFARYGAKQTPKMLVGADLVINGEKISYDGLITCIDKGNLALSHRIGASASAAKDCDAVEVLVMKLLKRVMVYHFNDTSSFAGVRSCCGSHDYRTLHSDGGNLAAFLYMLEEAHPIQYERICSTIQQVFPVFGSFDIAPDRRYSNKILLEWRERENDYLFGPDSVPDGALRFVCLATLLLQPFDHPDAPKVVVIDEPEMGLHPRAIALLVSMLSAASKRVQVVVSTQSPTLVSALKDAKSVILVRRDARGTVLRRLETEALSEWIADYDLGDLWQNGTMDALCPIT